MNQMTCIISWILWGDAELETQKVYSRLALVKVKERKQDRAGGAVIDCHARSDRASIINVEYVLIQCLTRSLAEDGLGEKGLPFQLESSGEPRRS